MASSSMPIESETLQNSVPTLVAANVGTEGATSENQPRKKQKKLSSNVWEYFDRVETTKVVHGKKEKDVTATCKVCSEKLDAKSKHGTSHLRNHYNAKDVLKYQSSVQQVAHVGGGSVPGGNSGDGDEDGESEFDQFMSERSQPWNIKSDLDQYIERRATAWPRGQDFDVLGWWKTEGQEYPILSKVARDVLAVPVSTVASESAFSTGGRVINAYRSKLDSEAVEALVCVQDWVRGDKKGRAASVFDFIEETEEDGSCFEDGDGD